MDIVIKLTLVASIVMMGYNISEFLTPYKALSLKIDEIKKVAAETKATDSDLRRSNFILSFILSVIFSVLIYFSGFAFWVFVVVVAKMVLTLYLSDSLLVCSLHADELPKKNYMITKMDALANALMGLSLAFLAVL